MRPNHQGRTECGAPGAHAPGAIIRGHKIIEKLFHISFQTRFARDKYSRGWNTKHVQNANGRGLFCFPMVVCFIRVDKMAAILLIRTIGKPNFWLTQTVLNIKKNCVP